MKKKTLKLGGNKLPDTGGLEGLKKRTQERIDARRKEEHEHLGLGWTRPDWFSSYIGVLQHQDELEKRRNGCIQDGAYRAVNNWPDVDFRYYEKHCELSIRIGGFDISIQRGENQADGWVSPFGMVEKDEDFDGVFRITVHRADDFEMHLDDDADDTFYERALLDRVFKAEEGEPV